MDAGAGRFWAAGAKVFPTIGADIEGAAGFGDCVEIIRIDAIGIDADAAIEAGAGGPGLAAIGGVMGGARRGDQTIDLPSAEMAMVPASARRGSLAKGCQDFPVSGE